MGKPIQLDPDRVLFGLAGTDADHICIRESDGTVRRATKVERHLALLMLPRLRALVGRA
jgi:hypothetical protein